MANRPWITLMPPGIRHFIQRHCWYIIGGFPFSNDHGEYVHPIDCEPPYLTNNKMTLESSESNDLADYECCDIGLTDDEVESSKRVQIGLQPNVVRTENQETHEDSSDDDDTHKFFGSVSDTQKNTYSLKTFDSDNKSIECTFDSINQSDASRDKLESIKTQETVLSESTNFPNHDCIQSSLNEKSPLAK